MILSILFWRQYNIYKFLRSTRVKIVTLGWQHQRVKKKITRLHFASAADGRLIVSLWRSLTRFLG